MLHFIASRWVKVMGWHNNLWKKDSRWREMIRNSEQFCAKSEHRSEIGFYIFFPPTVRPAALILNSMLPNANRYQMKTFLDDSEEIRPANTTTVTVFGAIWWWAGLGGRPLHSFCFCPTRRRTSGPRSNGQLRTQIMVSNSAGTVHLCVFCSCKQKKMKTSNKGNGNGKLRLTAASGSADSISFEGSRLCSLCSQQSIWQKETSAKKECWRCTSRWGWETFNDSPCFPSLTVLRCNFPSSGAV